MGSEMCIRDRSKLHPGQVIPFATHANQKKLLGNNRSSDARFGKYFQRLAPDEVAPTAEAVSKNEYLLVARGAIPEHLFEPLPSYASLRTSQSAGP